MAREIHDTLAQGFAGIVLQLEATEQALDDDTASVQDHLNRARQLARESLSEARRSVRALRPQTLEDQTLSNTLRQYLDLFARDTGTKVDFVFSGDSKVIPATIEDALLRISQEAIANTRKHAAAHHMSLTLSVGETKIILTIADDGRGFDPEAPAYGRFGLIGIRERVQALDGTFAVSSELGKGTSLNITIPYDGGDE
jgi:signal transduction histidine kinase